MVDSVKELAPQILEEIKKANHILLHCHPNPDGDSLGSSLAFYHALTKLGKDVDIIIGDSELPQDLSILPGFDKILAKNYFQINLEKYDLFIINDSSSLDRISRLGEIKFPRNLKTIVIDHHISNTGFGDINLTEPEYIAASQIVYDLFKIWNFEITSDIAKCLLVGIYTDSGGLKYSPTDPATIKVFSELVEIVPNYNQILFEIENSNKPQKIFYEGLALNSIHSYFNDHVAISEVTYEQLSEKGIKKEHIANSSVSNVLISVIGWDIGISVVEADPEEIYISMRTRDSEKYDVSKIAVALGGGGHKAAAGATINKPFNEAKQLLLETIGKVYPELGKP